MYKQVCPYIYEHVFYVYIIAAIDNTLKTWKLMKCIKYLAYIYVHHVLLVSTEFNNTLFYNQSYCHMKIFDQWKA